MDADNKTGKIILGDCIEILAGLPEKSVDLVFADPPYNLQLSHPLWRPNLTRVDAVKDKWDQFASLDEYDNFSRKWLAGCRRVLRDKGSIWVIGTYHNIFRIGSIMQDLGYWFLNDIVWIKNNPMPNFRGARFTNAHETLIWACKSKGAKYTFNYQVMKTFNDGVQMRSDWHLPLCTGRERLRLDGKKSHPTQKPEALIYRILMATTKPGDVILDPFFGSGTTGAVAKKLRREWIGIEQDAGYAKLAAERIESIPSYTLSEDLFGASPKHQHVIRVSVGTLLEQSLLEPGQLLYFQKDPNIAAELRADGRLQFEGRDWSIHQLGKRLSGGGPCNGWEHWYFLDMEGLHPLNLLREFIWAQKGEIP